MFVHDVQDRSRFLTTILWLYRSSLLFNEDTPSSTNSENEDEYKTEHENRITELTMNDAVHRVDILWYFQTQVSL